MTSSRSPESLPTVVCFVNGRQTDGFKGIDISCAISLRSHEDLVELRKMKSRVLT